MKNKRLLALLMTVLMIATMIASAIPASAAYTAVTPSGSASADADDVTGLTHTMTLSSGYSKLLYDVTYNFTVDDPQAVGTTYANLEQAVTGTPTITPITYTAGETFTKASGATNYTLTKPVTVNWSGVQIMEPGVYRWKVTKAKVQADSVPENFSNDLATTYLWAFATVGTDDALNVAWGLATNDNLTNKTNFNDNFPANTYDLTIKKNVSGNGSKEQYFKFTVTITMPITGTAGDGDYVIEGINETVPETAYNEATTNPTAITVTEGTGTEDIWLKHGQQVTIKGLPLNTAYTVVEAAEGYNIAIVVEGDDNGMTKTDGKNTANVTDTGLSKATTVTFNNSKEITTPTGIILAAAPAVTVIALGSVGLGILGVSKKRKEEEAE